MADLLYLYSLSNYYIIITYIQRFRIGVFAYTGTLFWTIYKENSELSVHFFAFSEFRVNVTDTSKNSTLLSDGYNAAYEQLMM